jgi:acyl dehydratase
MIIGKYYEELNPGDRFTSIGRTMTETDIINYVCIAGLMEELFINAEFINGETVFKRRVAPVGLLFTFAAGMMVQIGIFHGTALAWLGVDGMKMKAPVFVGDTVHLELEIKDKKKTSKTDRGILWTDNRLLNQKNEEVMVFEQTMMIRTQP